MALMSYISHPKDMKTWEDYKQSWSNEIERLRYSENQLDKMKYAYIEQGLDMSCIPPVGIELPITEYRQLKEDGYDLHEIHGWCYSGKDMHERVRPYNVGQASRISGVNPTDIAGLIIALKKVK